MKRSAIEAGTGLVLVSFPSLFVRLLLGVELSEPGQIVGRLAGFALIALVLACWPRGGTEGAAASSLRALLVFSVLVALYLVYLGIGGGFAGGPTLARGCPSFGRGDCPCSRVGQHFTKRGRNITLAERSDIDTTEDMSMRLAGASKGQKAQLCLILLASPRSVQFWSRAGVPVPSRR